MIILGALLLVIGLVLGIYLLWVVGLILLLAGIVLALLGTAGHAVGGRPHYW